MKFKKYEKSEVIPVAVLVAVYLVSAAMLFIQYSRTKEQLTADFTSEKVLSARYAAKELTEFLQHEQVALENIAGLVSLTGSLEKGRTALQNFMTSHKRKPRIYSFTVTDPKGHFMYSVPEDLEGRYMQDLSGEAFYRETVRNRKFYNGGAVMDAKGELSLTLAAPIMSSDGKGKILGVVSEKIMVPEIAARFINSIDPGRGGYAFLLDESGRLIGSQRGGRLYQIEGSSDTLRRMLKGEEGAVTGRSSESGREELTVFSPVRFSGRVWSVGLVAPSLELYAEARKDLERTLLIISLMTLAFSWSLVSSARSSRYKAGIMERTKFSEYLMSRNAELSALNDFAGAISPGEDLDSVIGKAIGIMASGAAVRGAAVRLLSGPGGRLCLKMQSGMPEEFVGKEPCEGTEECACARAMAGGGAVFLSGPEEAGPGCAFKKDGELAIIPLVVRKKALGVLYVLTDGESAFPAEREKFLTAFGNQLAASIENALQIEDIKRHAARASALFKTSQVLTRSLAMDDLLQIIMKEASALLKVKRSMLFLYKEEENMVECRVALGFEEMQPSDLKFSPSGIFWESMRDGGVKIIDLAEKSADAPASFVKRMGHEKVILVPLVSKGRVLGFIALDMMEQGRAALEDLKMVVGFASQAAVAIETSSFYIRTMEKYNEDLQDLSNRIITAQEEERKRISRDLHDELGQSLTAIKINLDMVKAALPPDFEQLKGRIADAISLVSQTLDSVRRLSFELRPSMLDDLGLITVLGRLVSDFKKRTGFEVEFEHEGMSERLRQDMEVSLYRVVQEALTNIMKHSGARKVKIFLKHEEELGMVFLKVEDDGVGMEKDPGEAKGFGLMGMRERVSLLGGNFRVSSQKGSGTRILIDIPYSKDDMQKRRKA